MILNYIKEHAVGILSILLVITLGLLAYNWYNYNYVRKQVTFDSQNNAATIQGVKNAAKNAQVGIDNTQSKEVSSRIEYIVTHEVQPEYIVPTTAKNAEKVIKDESKKNKADFSIVTDPNNPDEKVDLNKYSFDTPINLNQYNIHAYKKVIRTISYAPSEKIVGASIQRKINDHGTYIGVGVDYNIKDKKAYGKIMLSW